MDVEKTLKPTGGKDKQSSTKINKRWKQKLTNNITDGNNSEKEIKPFGYTRVLRHNKYVRNKFEGKLLVIREKVSPRRKMIDDVIQTVGCKNYQEIKQTKESK